MGKLYWYELTMRGVSPGAYPRGAFTSEVNHINKEGKDYGAVAYLEPLAQSQVESYELRMIDPPRKLYDYEEMMVNGYQNT